MEALRGDSCAAMSRQGCEGGLGVRTWASLPSLKSLERLTIGVITRNCEHCGKEFRAKNFKVQIGAGRFCSQPCSKKAARQRLLKEPWVNDAVSRYKSGRGCKLIAREMGLRCCNVRAVMRRLGVYDSNRALGKGGVPHNRWTQKSRIDAMYARYLKGYYRAEWPIKRDCHWHRHPACAPWFAWHGLSAEERSNRVKRVCERIAKREREDVHYRIMRRLRFRLWKFYNGKRTSISKLVGISRDGFLKHLQSHFEPGMTLENYGRGGWHIDHVIPCTAFDLSDPEQQAACNHYTNLRPVWESENISKSDKLPDGRRARHVPVQLSMARFYQSSHPGASRQVRCRSGKHLKMQKIAYGHK